MGYRPNLSSFSPQTTLADGHTGLDSDNGSTCEATLQGNNLAAGLTVKVTKSVGLYWTGPLRQDNPGFDWNVTLTCTNVPSPLPGDTEGVTVIVIAQDGTQSAPLSVNVDVTGGVS